MSKHPGEKAMALVDGQLAPSEVPALVQELARSPALVAELQAYLTTSGRRLAEPFAAKAGEPVPAWLIDSLRQARGARPAGAVARGPSLIGALKRRHLVPAWSLAAGPALAAGLAVAVWLGMPATPADVIAAHLAVGLERTESGKDASVVALRPVLSFKSKADGWCRQYELRYASRQASHGLACRGEGGRWNVVASTAPAPIGPRPAGSEPRRAIDDLVTAMMGDQPLSNGEEAARISGGWPRP
jgi:hypothetical protein